jgi:chromosome segregation ATPase
MMNSQGLALVEAEYAKLQECIDNLKETIDSNLSEQKEELETIHQSQISKLSIDIDQLKAEKMKLEEAIAANERANLLENERDWYKKEALHLDKVLEESKSECKELKMKLDESNNDRKWMKEQLEKVRQ